jgi:putative transposase
MMVAFLDAHREEYGVEPICTELPIAPSTYYEHKVREKDARRLPPRVRRERWLSGEAKRVWEENFQVYGAHKVWKQLKRERLPAARCTVERLMRQMGLRGAVRGRTFKTTVAMQTTGRPADLVQRQFTATRPNQLWVADFSVPQRHRKEAREELNFLVEAA